MLLYKQRKVSLLREARKMCSFVVKITTTRPVQHKGKLTFFCILPSLRTGRVAHRVPSSLCLVVQLQVFVSRRIVHQSIALTCCLFFTLVGRRVYPHPPKPTHGEKVLRQVGLDSSHSLGSEMHYQPLVAIVETVLRRQRRAMVPAS